MADSVLTASTFSPPSATRAATSSSAAWWSSAADAGPTVVASSVAARRVTASVPHGTLDRRRHSGGRPPHAAILDRRDRAPRGSLRSGKVIVKPVNSPVFRRITAIAGLVHSARALTLTRPSALTALVAGDARPAASAGLAPVPLARTAERRRARADAAQPARRRRPSSASRSISSSRGPSSPPARRHGTVRERAWAGTLSATRSGAPPPSRRFVGDVLLVRPGRGASRRPRGRALVAERRTFDPTEWPRDLAEVRHGSIGTRRVRPEPRARLRPAERPC